MKETRQKFKNRSRITKWRQEKKMKDLNWYINYKEKEKERLKAYRKQQRDSTVIQKEREMARDCKRQKLKEVKSDYVKKSKPFKIQLTFNRDKSHVLNISEMTPTQFREYWRLKKRDQRQKLSSQKLKRIKEKDMVRKRIMRSAESTNKSKQVLADIG